MCARKREFGNHTKECASSAAFSRIYLRILGITAWLGQAFGFRTDIFQMCILRHLKL